MSSARVLVLVVLCHWGCRAPAPVEEAPAGRAEREAPTSRPKGALVDPAASPEARRRSLERYGSAELRGVLTRAVHGLARARFNTRGATPVVLVEEFRDETGVGFRAEMLALDLSRSLERGGYYRFIDGGPRPAPAEEEPEPTAVLTGRIQRSQDPAAGPFIIELVLRHIARGGSSGSYGPPLWELRERFAR